jgi:hypothetical protein
MTPQLSSTENLGELTQVSWAVGNLTENSLASYS